MNNSSKTNYNRIHCSHLFIYRFISSYKFYINSILLHARLRRESPDSHSTTYLDNNVRIYQRKSRYFSLSIDLYYLKGYGI